jgi:hypothetical protein
VKQLNIFEKLLDWLRHRIAEWLPDSIKRLVLYELVDRVESERPEELRDFWGVTCEQMYSKLRDQ